MSLGDEQWRFIHYIIQQASLEGAFGVRGKDTPIYSTRVSEDDKADLHRTLYRSLDSYAGQYFGQVKDDQRRDDQHCKNLEDLANTLSDEFQSRNVLANDRFRIGIAQKALNLYLKFLWCLDKIPTPPHCPFDKGIIDRLRPTICALKLPDPPPWPKLDSIEHYQTLVTAAREQAKKEGLSIAEWELKHWQPAGAAGAP